MNRRIASLETQNEKDEETITQLFSLSAERDQTAAQLLKDIADAEQAQATLSRTEAALRQELSQAIKERDEVSLDL
ncbi:hypothetical protein PLICRDRAFT_174275 [Plicaturopsis crispa FD-325 SS-3]|nr:hypothetical protein PLICRDRAFT_174275 [Plicaturopsis crispa FD-325 SS-3]